jgi:uncharacterized protein YbbC (DUF1343 family)
MAGLVAGCSTPSAVPAPTHRDPVAPPASATSAPASAAPGTPAAATAAPALASATAVPAPTLRPTVPGRVLTGIDVLMRDKRDALRGLSIGLVTNATGRDASGRTTIDVLFGEASWSLRALFSPEHGIRGDAEAGQSVETSRDARTGLPIYSLYGDTVRPTRQMLAGLDTLVYDIQDVGARVFTYASTLLEVMRAGAEHGVRVAVLDRPDPINGVAVEGTVLDPRFTSFVGAAPIAMRYGMTLGELGRYFNGELGVGCDFLVVPLAGWQRTEWLDDTGIRWVNPSPNLRSLTAATLYPGMVLVEGTNLSEGRGTERPFEWLGAPWVDSAAWLDRLTRLNPAGVRFEPASRTPTSSKHAGKVCQGLLLTVTDRNALRPVELGVMLLATAGQALTFDNATLDRLAGTDRLRLALQSRTPPQDIAASWQPALEAFRTVRARYLLY